MAEAVQVLAGPCPAPVSCPRLRRGNVHGALDMGLAPGLLPGRVTFDAGRDWFTDAWGSVPDGRGRDTGAILASAAGWRPDGADGAAGEPRRRARACSGATR